MITKEKLVNHIGHLKEKHDSLDKQIKELYEHHTDDLTVEKLKKEKLKLKDEIEQELRKLDKIQ